MPRINLFKKIEVEKFDAPTILTDKERRIVFTVREIRDNDLSFRKRASKLGFVLQLGYFLVQKKFFTPDQFHQGDIDYVTNILGFQGRVDISKYRTSSYAGHRGIILDLLGYTPFSEFRLVFEKEAKAMVKTSLKPKDIFYSLIDFLEERKIERPKYYVFADAISRALNSFESDLIDQIDGILTGQQKEILDGLMILPSDPDELTARKPYLITKLKRPNQGTAPKKIRDSLGDFHIIKDLHSSFNRSLEEIGISRELLNYYAVWVIKAEHIQFESISSISMKRLYLIAFIIYQFRLRQDLFVDTLLQCVQKYFNETDRIISKDFLNQNQIGTAKKKGNFTRLRNIILSSKQQIREAKTILYSPTYGEDQKIELLKDLIPIKEKSFQDELLEELERIDALNMKGLRDRMYYGQLSKGYRKIQNRVGGIIQALEFNPVTSDKDIMTAILDYQNRKGRVTEKSPMDFILEKDQKWVEGDMEENGMNLYKVFLFKEVAHHIKAGSLNLKYSDKYRSIDEYLIGAKEWSADRTELIKRANISELGDCPKFMGLIKERLNGQFESTNGQSEKNKHLKFGADGKARVVTPRSNTADAQGCMEILGKDQYLPLIDILSDIRHTTNISKAFTHFSRKTSKRDLSDDVLFAAIIGLGCNIGVRKMGKISKGMGADKLEYVARWYFSKENLDKANRRILAVTENLSLPNIFLNKKDILHTSSDGQKYNVSVPSLHARHSYKYFGFGKGVSAYSFIDEQNRLFYNTIISTSEREAGYVLDGLMHNENIESGIHSTDTHGYSEIVFAICNALGVFFAPRIKNHKNQLLYTFKKHPRKLYEKKGYRILPSKGTQIDEAVLAAQWDNILRLLCTIKLKQAKASEILGRLSSYSKQHPLYRAVKITPS